MPQALKKFMQLTKVDVAKNLIYGTFTAEVLDKSGEIADYPSTKAAIETWSADMLKTSGGKSKGNISLMHGDKVAGIVKDINYHDDAKVIHGCVEVKPEVTADAQKGYLNGFSIGGSYAKKWEDPVHKGHQRFTPIISEISVVDNPCVPIAIFDAIKDASFVVVGSDGVEAMHKFAPKEVEAPMLKLDQVFRAHDGSIHDTQELAKAKNDEIAAAKVKEPVIKSLEKLEALALDKADPAVAEKLAKAMHHVAQLANVVNQLHGLAKDHENEKGENHPVTNKLKKHVRGLADTMSAMADDEAGDVNDDCAAKVTAAKELLKDWKDPDEKDALVLKEATTALLAKDAELAKISAERDALKKTIEEVPARIDAALGAIEKRLTEQASQIKKIAEQPAGAAGQLFIVEKESGTDKAKPVTARHASPADFVRNNS